MEWIITVVYSGIFFYFILQSSYFRIGAIPQKYFGMVFILKIVAGIFLGYLYHNYFNGGDTFLFFDNAKKMHGVFAESPADFLKIVSGFDNDTSLEKYYSRLEDWTSYEFFYSDSRTVVRLNAILLFFSFGFYNVHVVFFSFLSLIGLNGLFKIFVQAAPGKEKSIFAAVFLIPSVLFWSSGILKEGILMFAIGIFIYSLNQFTRKKFSYKYLLLIFIGITFLLLIKVYVLFLLLPGIIALMWATHTENRNVLLKFISCYLIFSILVFSLQFFHDELNIIKIIYWKHHNFKTVAQHFGSGSYYELPLLEPTLWGIVKNIPAAILNVFIQPDWKHFSNPFAWVAALENIFTLLFILLSLFFRNKIRDEQKPLFYLSLFFVLALYALIGLTTPVIGSLVRYKTPALPFLLFVCILLLDSTKIFKRKIL